LDGWPPHARRWLPQRHRKVFSCKRNGLVRNKNMSTELALIQHQEAPRSRFDRSHVPCNGCGNKRDNPRRARCKACLAKDKRELRAKNPQHHKELYNNWKKRNPEKVKEYAKKNYQKHKERWKAQALAWGKKNKQKRVLIMIFQNQKRRSRIKANGGDGFTIHHWRQLKEIFSTCAYCRTSPIQSIDHFVPISLGGQHDYRNLVPACKHCNSTKRNNEPRQWVKSTYGQERLDFVLSNMLK
jgi:hypothetical protein